MARRRALTVAGIVRVVTAVRLRQARQGLLQRRHVVMSLPPRGEVGKIGMDLRKAC